MNENGMPEKQGEESSVNSDVLAEVKKRFQMCVSADGENHREALSDLTFLKGDQWPQRQKQQREAEGRPCLTINKLPTFLQQVTNNQRQNRASIKVSPTGESADAKTAEVIQGMIRHIEYDSAADVAYDTAGNSAAAIGFGYFRFCTEYESEDSFDQVIRIKRIRNPFTVYFDPASTEPDGSDALFTIITEKISKNEFKIRYPEAVATIQGFDTVSIGDSQISNEHWIWADQVRVAEYLCIKMERATLFKFADGTTGWEDSKNPKNPVVGKRDSEKRKVMSYLVTPLEVLSTTEIKCKWIPVFPVYGAEIDIDGKIYRNGVIRNAKDPAMMYNFWMTSATEEVSLRPKTPYIGAVGQFEGQSKKWAQANVRSYPYLEYNPISLDGQLTPPPQRQQMADVPVGVLSMAAHANDNVKATTGLFDSSFGATGTATSGKQEIAQQQQGNVTNFHFIDNFYRTLRHAGKCLVNMIPSYYDTTRLVRARAEDGSVSAIRINAYDVAAQKVVHDVRTGQYDVAVSVGPSYDTMRAEAADAMVQFGQSWPKLMDIAGDKVVKAMNWPGAEEIAERIERTIPPEIKNDPANGPDPTQAMAQMQAQMAQMTEEMDDLREKADANYAKVTTAEIAKEASVEAQKIAADSRIEAAAISAEAKQYVQDSTARTEELVANIGAEAKKDVEELSGTVKLLISKMDTAAESARLSAEAEKRTVPPVQPTIPLPPKLRRSKKINITAPSGKSYTGIIEDLDD